MGAALPIVGLGMSAMGQMSQMSQQRKQAESQAKALEAQNLLARDQLKLSQEQARYQQQVATVQRERAKAIADAQEAQAYQQMQELTLKQEAAYTQAGMETYAFNEQVNQAVTNLLTQASQAAAQQDYQSAATLGQLADQLGKQADVQGNKVMSEVALTGGDARVNRDGALEQAYQEALKMFQGIGEGVASADRTNQYGKEIAAMQADLQKRIGNNAVGFMNSQLNFQKASDAIANPSQVRDIGLQAQRNQVATDAAYYSGIGASNLSQLAAQYDYMNTTTARNAQIDGIRSSKPGLLSYANVGLGLYNALNQYGVFDSRGSNTPPPPQSFPSTQMNWGYNNNVKITPWGSVNTPAPSVAPQSNPVSPNIYDAYSSGNNYA